MYYSFNMAFQLLDELLAMAFQVDMDRFVNLQLAG